ncbi:VOC family protein [Paenibacillus terrigena]|uniref:VOC family protein n=1 Tax=Paenibacillus terrigena TaxID=369333 RepID=UPI00037E0515|nr:VOC family protein [Paenibacillus terrigena]
MQLAGSYLYIPVSHLNNAAAWYTKHFSFRVYKEDALFIELRSESGVRIMLIPNEEGIYSHMHYSTGTQAVYGFVVMNIHEVYQELKDAGIQVTAITDYEGLSFKFYDPDQNMIELWGDYPQVGWTVFESLNKNNSNRRSIQ